jgi:hypothetical protein
MGSLLALAFIAGVAAVGVFVGTRPTVADGRVIAGTITSGSKVRGLVVECDPEIPIGVAGAVFRCSIAAGDGSTAEVEYTMNRAGAYSADVRGSTGPTRPAPKREADRDEGDPP